MIIVVIVLLMMVIMPAHGSGDLGRWPTNFPKKELQWPNVTLTKTKRLYTLYRKWRI